MLKILSGNIFVKRQTYLSLIRSVAETVPLHTHDFYEIVVVLRGSMVHLVNGGHQILQKGQSVLLRPTDTHAFAYNGKQDCSFLNLAFSCAMMGEICRFLDVPSFPTLYGAEPLPPVTALREETVQDARRIYRELCLLDPDAPAGEVKGKLLIARIMEEGFLLPRTEEAVPPWFAHLESQMCLPEVFSGSLSQLAQLSGRTPEHLCRAFRKYRDATPMEVLTARRMDYAANLLRMSAISITQISLECGYTSLSHFYSRFEAKFGLSPAAYRKKFRYRPE